MLNSTSAPVGLKGAAPRRRPRHGWVFYLILIPLGLGLLFWGVTSWLDHSAHFTASIAPRSAPGSLQGTCSLPLQGEISGARRNALCTPTRGDVWYRTTVTNDGESVRYFGCTITAFDPS
jgi:hypothetical protein